jgi:outer membrane receptor protein involved in Fe transport
VPDKVVARFNWAKTIARPQAGRLIPFGTCTFDERFVGESDADGSERDQVCSNTMGNPALKAQTNRNKNLSLEWYVNKDFMLAGSVYKQTGLIGAGTLVEQINGARLFAGSDEIDQQTGRPLSEQQFNYRRWTNQLPSERKGWEVSTKMAFTFLPWHFRYLGLDANYTRNKSQLIGTVSRELLTGDVLPVVGESPANWNASLWYDDGALSARVALQVVGTKLNCFGGCNNNAVSVYPAQGLTNVRGPVYNISSPVFQISTRYLDAKVGYKFKNGVEVFVEGRNLGRIHTGTNTGGYATYADGTPNVYVDSYAGSTVMAGVVFKIQ